MERCCTDGRLGFLSIEAPEFYYNDTWPLMNGHLSAISDITFNGRIFIQVRPTSYDAEAVVGFLRVLLGKSFSNAE